MLLLFKRLFCDHNYKVVGKQIVEKKMLGKHKNFNTQVISFCDNCGKTKKTKFKGE